MKFSKTYAVREYVTPEGHSPYRDWIDSLDVAIKVRIQARILRFELGNLGDYKSVEKGVFEARFSFGPGYRLYFGIDKGSIVILLLGGEKNSQRRDIQKAQSFWADYLRGGKYGSKK